MARPKYVQQFQPNNCWAACLEMWMQGEAGWAWTQEQITNSAGDFDLGPGGIDVNALGGTIRWMLQNQTLQMEWRIANKFEQLPYIETILEEVGNVYVAYKRQKGGHANVIWGYTSSGFLVHDPDPSVGSIVKSRKTLFGLYPCFVGWRRTSSTFGYDYSGRPPWDYAPPQD